MLRLRDTIRICLCYAFGSLIFAFGEESSPRNQLVFVGDNVTLRTHWKIAQITRCSFDKNDNKLTCRGALYQGGCLSNRTEEQGRDRYTIVNGTALSINNVNVTDEGFYFFLGESSNISSAFVFVFGRSTLSCKNFTGRESFVHEHCVDHESNGTVHCVLRLGPAIPTNTCTNYNCEQTKPIHEYTCNKTNTANREDTTLADDLGNNATSATDERKQPSPSLNLTVALGAVVTATFVMVILSVIALFMKSAKAKIAQVHAIVGTRARSDAESRGTTQSLTTDFGHFVNGSELQHSSTTSRELVTEAELPLTDQTTIAEAIQTLQKVMEPVYSVVNKSKQLSRQRHAECAPNSVDTSTLQPCSDVSNGSIYNKQVESWKGSRMEAIYVDIDHNASRHWRTPKATSPRSVRH